MRLARMGFGRIRRDGRIAEAHFRGNLRPPRKASPRRAQEQRKGSLGDRDRPPGTTASTAWTAVQGGACSTSRVPTATRRPVVLGLSRDAGAGRGGASASDRPSNRSAVRGQPSPIESNRRDAAPVVLPAIKATPDAVVVAVSASLLVAAKTDSGSTPSRFPPPLPHPRRAAGIRSVQTPFDSSEPAVSGTCSPCGSTHRQSGAGPTDSRLDGTGSGRTDRRCRTRSGRLRRAAAPRGRTTRWRWTTTPRRCRQPSRRRSRAPPSPTTRR